MKQFLNDLNLASDIHPFEAVNYNVAGQRMMSLACKQLLTEYQDMCSSQVFRYWPE